LPWLV